MSLNASRHQTPTIQNADHDGASSNQNVEDMLRLHPFDHDKPATFENPSGYVDQEPTGEPISKSCRLPMPLLAWKRFLIPN